jgi:hypothetical protein
MVIKNAKLKERLGCLKVEAFAELNSITHS